jgi:hypothetical protein
MKHWPFGTTISTNVSQYVAISRLPHHSNCSNLSSQPLPSRFPRDRKFAHTALNLSNFYSFSQPLSERFSMVVNLCWGSYPDSGQFLGQTSYPNPCFCTSLWETLINCTQLRAGAGGVAPRRKNFSSNRRRQGPGIEATQTLITRCQISNSDLWRTSCP